MPQAPNLVGDYETDWPQIKQFMEEISSGIELENFDGQEITHTFTTGGVAEAVAHKIGRIPRRFLILSSDKAMTLHQTASSISTITLECSASDCTVKFLVQ